jgi:hypothetical protein
MGDLRKIAEPLKIITIKIKLLTLSPNLKSARKSPLWVVGLTGPRKVALNGEDANRKRTQG